MSYSVGSIADLISGKTTPNKRKVITQNVKLSSPSETNKSSTKSEGIKRKQPRQQENNKTKIPYASAANASLTFSKQIESDSAAAPKLSNAVKRIKAKQSKQNVMAKMHHDMYKERTVFIGNVPIGTTQTKLKKRFSVYGPIETIRFRSVPVPDEKTPKKVAAIKQEFHSKRTSLHSYIKFEKAEDSQKALVENGRVYDGHHMRVSHCQDNVAAKRDQSKALFVGNLSFESEEEDLWAAFGNCGTIESVRIVRDRRTSIGKGFGYINFTSADAVQLGLQMVNVMVRNRELRITACDTETNSKKKRAVKRKQSPSSAETTTTEPAKKKNNVGGKDLPKDGTAANFSGLKFTEMKKKKKLDKGATRKNKLAKLFTPRAAPPVSTSS